MVPEQRVNNFAMRAKRRKAEIGTLVSKKYSAQFRERCAPGSAVLLHTHLEQHLDVYSPSRDEIPAFAFHSHTHQAGSNPSVKSCEPLTRSGS